MAPGAHPRRRPLGLFERPRIWIRPRCRVDRASCRKSSAIIKSDNHEIRNFSDRSGATIFRSRESRALSKRNVRRKTRRRTGLRDRACVHAKTSPAVNFVELLRSLPHPGKEYLDAVERASFGNQPHRPRSRNGRADRFQRLHRLASAASSIWQTFWHRLGERDICAIRGDRVRNCFTACIALERPRNEIAAMLTSRRYSRECRCWRSILLSHESTRRFRLN